MGWTKEDWERATGLKAYPCVMGHMFDGPHGLSIVVQPDGWVIDQYHATGPDPASLARWLDATSHAYAAEPQEPTLERVKAHEAAHPARVPVVKVQGHPACIALTHVEIVGDAAGGAE